MKEANDEKIVDEIMDIIRRKNKDKRVIGLCENIIIKGSKKEKKVKAKIDTGASDSSISIRLFREIGETKVVKEVVVERAHEEETRPLVRLLVKCDNKWIESEFTVSDRKNMKYEVLIGDNTLRKMHVLVDPEKKDLENL